MCLEDDSHEMSGIIFLKKKKKKKKKEEEEEKCFKVSPAIVIRVLKVKLK